MGRPVAGYQYVNEITQPFDFILYDASGRKGIQMKINNRETEINVEELGSGLYFYGLQGSDKTGKTTGRMGIK